MKTATYLCFPLLAAVAAAITPEDAEAAFTTLQQWYNESIGLWTPSTGWWNSANGLNNLLLCWTIGDLTHETALTMIANLAKFDDSVKTQAGAIYPNTFVKAQQYNLQMQKTVDSSSLIHCHYGDHWPYFPHGHRRPRPHPTNGFLNDYYDDEGWWALAWIAVYDVTGQRKYLRIAESIFEDIAKAYGTTPCGGVWWDKAETYVNAIANELFMDIAAHLANRAGGKSNYYLNWAKTGWQWFQNSGLINSQNLINDGLTNDACENNGGTVWSYNQGVILGALSELSRATNNDSYITTAKMIADAAIANLTDSNGILHDPCEPDCGADGSQFKGVFTRNLQIVQEASPESRYQTFLRTNADSIWANDRTNGNELSLIWSGPFIQPANASTQSSAMDCIVAVVATS